MRRLWSLLAVGALAIAGLATAGAYLADTAGAERTDVPAKGAARGAAGDEPVTQPLRDEHARLMPHIEDLRAAGDAVGVAPAGELREKVASAYEFLSQELIPHAKAEDKVLYAEIDHLFGDVPMTATMSRDHVEVAKLTDELGGLQRGLAQPATEETEQELRRVLYGSYALVKLHFAKEEEVYLPILDKRLTPEQARELFERMDAAAQHGH